MSQENVRRSHLPPLRDDVAERYSPSRLKWLNLCDKHYSVLLKSLRRQMRERPDVWGIGFWEDEQDERIARTCADLMARSWGLPNNRLIPEDDLCLAMSFGEDDPMPFSEIEESFRFVFEQDWYLQKRTFADLVSYVRGHEGTASLAEIKARCKPRYGCFVVLVLAVLGVIALKLFLR